MIPEAVRQRPQAPPAVDRFDVFGYGFALVTGSTTARQLVRRLYLPFGTEDDGARTTVFRLETHTVAGGRAWRVLLGCELLAERRSLGAALRQLEYEVCLRVIAHRSDLIVLHGATVFAAEGTALITGPSGAGKSTLALALAARGYCVGGDDIAFLDPRTGAVQPLPRCSHLDARSRRLLRQVGLRLPDAATHHGFVTPADLGAVAPLSAPVRRLWCVGRGMGPRPQIVSVAQAEMVTLLLSEAGWASAPATAALAALGRLVGGAACYRLSSGRLDTTVAAVAALLGPR